MKMKSGAIVIEGHVQGLSNTRSLGEAGMPVIVVDTTNCVARYSKYCVDFYKCPSFNSDEFADFLIDLNRKKDLNGWLLLPSNDHAVLTISRNRTRLEKIFKVITPDLNIIENIYDKARLLKIADDVKVPIPEYFCVHSPKIQDFPLSFPVLVKGRFGLDFYKTTGRKAFFSNNMKDLRELLLRINRVIPLRNTITQEVIQYDENNKTVSFAAFCVNGDIRTYWMGEKLREHPLRFGTATFARSVDIKECIDLSLPLLKALKYTGPCEVEYLKDPRDGKYKLIEINPRTWLWVGLAKACGVDITRNIYEYVNGLDISINNTYKKGLFWINPLTDTVYSLKAILGGHLKVAEYFKTIFEEKENALFSIEDWKPGVAYLFHLYLYLKRR